MKLLKEPLLHFVVIGGLLFAAYQHFNPKGGEPGETEIVVSAGRIEQLSAIFSRTWQRRPTKEELQHLVDDFIIEEIYYREATAAGLDRDDTLIRRRMRQKLEFLTDDLATTTPGDDELRQFVEKHPDRFRVPGSATFRQIFFTPEKLGDAPDDALAATTALLAKGELPEGHASLLPQEMSNATPAQIAGTFGKDFADQLGELPAGQWSKPLRSSFGYHFVRVDERILGELPTLDKIRPQALREWEREQREQFREKFDRKLREKYHITIKWPEGESPKA
jgi:hypothetical protein